MKLLAKYEGLAVPATVETADLPQDTFVTVTGDATVDKAAGDVIAIGRLVKSPTAADGPGTVETRFKEKVSGEADGAIAAGDLVKLGALNGAIQTFKKWVTGTDVPELIHGICWVGGADQATVEVLTN